ncbi:MAG TPA: peptide MFS transporter [Thermoanaerobaculia bacterium]|jgi:POT family proton-dependent oligopeptide transporter|nr:peptide MFS transporter [Thermoanaerobaculia bacterium]
MAQPAQPVKTAASDTSFFGHPRGLATLFFTEYWERFSYYGMRALLILFMTAGIASGGLGYDTAKAGAIYGLYTASVYLLALPGGWVADRLLGQRRAVLFGGILIACGHFSMAIDSVQTFFLGLVLIVLGTGLLKPNVSTMVAELYPEGGSRRDAGFSIFYMGINLGAFLSPLVCGPLGQRVNWHLGFAVAGLGMVLGLIQYVLGSKHLGTAGIEPSAATSPAERAKARNFLLAAVGVLVVVIGLIWSGTVPINAEAIAKVTGYVIGGLVAVYFAYQFISGGFDSTERKRVLAIFVLFLFSSVFWSGFEQAGSSLNLFAQERTDPNGFGFNMPASVLQSVNPLLIILCAPLFAWLWVRLSKSKLEPSAPAKFSLGLILLGGGFFVMIGAAKASAGGVLVSPLWLCLTYLFHTAGELCVSPVGLSTVTKLAPQRIVGQMMGIWFMSISLGNLIAGLVAGRFQSLPLPQLFGNVVINCVIAGVILALLIRPIRRLMSGVH